MAAQAGHPSPVRPYSAVSPNKETVFFRSVDNLYKEFDIVKDEVGYGFQINGEYPALIENVRKGSPAERQGLEVGDRLVKIDQETIISRPHDDIVQLIRSRKRFRLTVLKNHAATESLLIPSNPIPVSSHEDDKSRNAGYNVTFAMISAEQRHLEEFTKRLSSCDNKTDEAQLRNQIQSSSQIIANLEKKIPRDVLEQRCKESGMVTECNSANKRFNRPENLSHTMPRHRADATADQEVDQVDSGIGSRLSRKTSFGDKWASKRDTVIGVLGAYATMKPVKLMKGHSFGSVGDLGASGRSRIPDKRRTGSMMVHGTYSDSDLSRNNYGSMDSLSPATPAFEASGFHHVPSSNNGDPSIKHIFQTAQRTVNFIKFVMLRESLDDGYFKLLHMMMFIRFGHWASNQKDDKKRKEAALAEFFFSPSSASYITLPMEIKNQPLSEIIVSTTLMSLVQKLLTSLFADFPNLTSVVNQEGTNPGKECAELIPAIEQRSDLPESIRNAWCRCIVTYIKIQNWKQHLKGPGFLSGIRSSTAYNGIFTSKRSPIDTNRPLKVTTTGHRFQVAPRVENTICANCRNVIIDGVHQCGGCQLYVHGECRSQLSQDCTSQVDLRLGKGLRSDRQRRSVFGGYAMTSPASSPTTTATSSSPTTSTSSLRPSLSSDPSRGELQYSQSDGVTNTRPTSVRRSDSDRVGPSRVSPSPRVSSRGGGAGPRGSSEPVAGAVAAAVGNLSPTQHNSDGSVTSIETGGSTVSSVSIDSVNDAVIKAFDVRSRVDEEFSAIDDFKTVDQLVSSERLQELKADSSEMKRQNILLEFANSERKQTFNLKLLRDVFDVILRDETHFRRLNDIMDFHHRFYIDLMTCMNEDFTFGDVGDVLIRVFSDCDYKDKFLKYNGWISTKTEHLSPKVLQQIRDITTENRILLNKRQLQDLVVTEVQRATKYKLLIEPLVKYAPQTHKSKMKTALTIITELASAIDRQKGHLDSMKKALSSLDRTAVDNDKSEDNSCLRDFNFMENELFLAGAYRCELKILEDKTKSKSKDNKSKQPKGIPNKMVKIPKMCYVMVYETHLILVEIPDSGHDSTVLKPWFHTGVRSILPIKPGPEKNTGILQVTPDVTTLNQDSGNNKPALVICTKDFFLNIYLDDVEQLMEWGRRLKILKGESADTFPVKWPVRGSSGNTSAAAPASGSTLSAAHIGLPLTAAAGTSYAAAKQRTNPDEYNFTEKAEYEGAEGGGGNDTPADGPTDPQDRIKFLRERVITLLNESFDLARKVYDPENSLNQEDLKLAHDYVMKDLCNLLNPELWISGVRQTDNPDQTNQLIPVIELNGSLAAEQVKSVPNIGHLLAKDAPMYETSIVKESDNFSSATGATFNAFSDDTDEKNEIHINSVDGSEIDAISARLVHKTNILHNEVNNTSSSSAEDMDVTSHSHSDDVTAGSTTDCTDESSMTTASEYSEQNTSREETGGDSLA